MQRVEVDVENDRGLADRKAGALDVLAALSPVDRDVGLHFSPIERELHSRPTGTISTIYAKFNPKNYPNITPIPVRA
jgi:hypothetical protein